MRLTGRRVLAMTAATLLTLSLGAGMAAADGAYGNRNAENTFTKWITAYPAMAGVVGGDVGAGTFAGEILSRSGTGTVADPVLITADYHFYGSHHSFTARVNIVEIGTAATISGVVTEGWLTGNDAAGEFTVISCTHNSITGTCFQGSLDILRGTKPGD